MSLMTTLELDRSDLSRSREVRVPASALADEEVRFRVDRFALTSNNVTYAVAGDVLDYWGFFPASEGWGRVPVMAYADVEESAHPAVAVGERVFGFFPMASHHVARVGRVRPAQFEDAGAHREGHAPAYRQFSRVGEDALYQPDREDQRLLLGGLFMTSFLIDDALREADGHGARAFLVSSASSKTSIALGWSLQRDSPGEVVGLTSERNREFVEGLGCYDRVVTYDAFDTLPDDPAVFVDMAGNAEVTRALHEGYGDALRASIVVGKTHVGSDGNTADLPGPEPTFFFAPGQIVKRAKDWGPEGLQQRMGAAYAAFDRWSDGWLEVRRQRGPAAVAAVFQELLSGGSAPEVGHILSMNDD